ncbi:hypothetical protein [Spiroplasma endosymbiont of Glossina fuscipes fuscipes]|uniref:hypothetical protein n=1 Tax=Spiroplasma endosymbiont of Glossina fuscipes fuscipes TaxID=2004463 RepID=UPI003C757AC4
MYESAKDEEHSKLKRNQMISALLQFLVKKEKIKSNSYINIYLDELENEEKWNKDETKLKEYLNWNYSVNRMIGFLRKQNIWIKELKHLNSIKDCIQGADIIANFSNKYLNSYNEIYKFLDLLKNHEIKILNCKFPKIVYNNCISNYKCNCCRPESSR